jgi:hypothetical protein
VEDRELVKLLSEVDPRGRDILRQLMRAKQPERDAFSDSLARQDSVVGSDLADLLDLASLNPEVRRQVARVLGGLETET